MSLNNKHIQAYPVKRIQKRKTYSCCVDHKTKTLHLNAHKDIYTRYKYTEDIRISNRITVLEQVETIYGILNKDPDFDNYIFNCSTEQIPLILKGIPNTYSIKTHKEIATTNIKNIKGLQNRRYSIDLELYQGISSYYADKYNLEYNAK